MIEIWYKIKKTRTITNEIIYNPIWSIIEIFFGILKYFYKLKKIIIYRDGAQDFFVYYHYFIYLLVISRQKWELRKYVC